MVPEACAQPDFALAKERALEWSRIGGAAFLTVDEQREAAGYGPMGSHAKYSPDQPRVFAGSPEGAGSGRAAMGAATARLSQPRERPPTSSSMRVARDPICLPRADTRLAPNDIASH